MGVTSNYSFPVPVATDLVKDGWDAINDLGVAVDTAMNTALGTKKAGMVLLNTTSFSAVSSQSLPTNTFSATYDNYVIWFYSTANSGGDVNFQMRLRASGTDATGASYDRTGYGATSTAGPTAKNAQGETTGILGSFGSANRMSAVINLYLPFQSQYTHWTGFQTLTNGPSPYFTFNNVSGQYGLTNSYDSVTLYPASGTMTGSLSVFGVNK